MSKARELADLVNAPIDDKEYVRHNGLWRRKKERFIVNGLNAVDIIKPSGATSARVRGHLYGNGVDGTVLFRYLNAGVDVVDANYSSWFHYTPLGSVSFTGYAAGALTGSQLSYLLGNGSIPSVLEVEIPLVRGTTSEILGGKFRCSSYPAAGSMYLTDGQFSYGGPTGTNYNGFRFFTGGPVWTVANGSYFDVEWSYT